MHQHTCGGCWGSGHLGAVAGWLAGSGCAPAISPDQGHLFMARCQAMIPSFPWGINCAVCFACTCTPRLPFPRVGSSWPHPHPHNRAAQLHMRACMAACSSG